METILRSIRLEKDGKDTVKILYACDSIIGQNGRKSVRH